ncbi:hypothetical protein [Geobacillus subterraneus]|nr:hypothetical protein [Geobacillus subterraneus]
MKKKNVQHKRFKQAFNVLSTAVMLSGVLLPFAPKEANAAVVLRPQIVDGGWYHSLAVGADGKVYAWGGNAYGQLGSRGVDYQTTPVQVQGLSNVVTVAAGDEFSLAVTADGKVYAWGRNDYGQLGNGTTTYQTTPVQVQGLSNVVAVAAGDYHSLAVTADGKVYAWGWNDSGLLGDGTTINQTRPVQVQGLSNVVAVAAGRAHSLALTADGKVYAWGSNSAGQLGDGTTTFRTTPVQVQGLSNVVTVAAGDGFSLAVTSDGKVYAWGSNNAGQLGDGTTTFRTMPVQVQGLSNVVAVAAGDYHSLAVTSDGKVYAWGFNYHGQLGDGTTASRTTPVQVQGLSNVVAVAAGNAHSFAVTSDGKVYAWGWNLDGALGDGTATARTTPVLVSSLTANASLLASGNETPPALPASPVIRASLSEWTNQSVQVTIQYPDGATAKEYRINDGAWQAYAGPIVMTKNGVIEARAGNQAGMSETVRYAVSNIDKTAPTLTLSQDPVSATNGDVVVYASAADDESGVDVLKWASGSQPAGYFASNGTVVSGGRFVVQTNGVYTVYAKDKAGNETVNTITVSNIDKDAPAAPTFTASKTAPTSQPVAVTVQYPNDAVKKEYRLNGGAWQVYTEPIVMTKNGVIEARATDQAGNASVASYTVSNIQTIAVAQPVAHVLPDTLMFDAPQGTTVQVKLNGGEWQAYTGPITLPDGLYDVEAKAVDSEGNESQALRMSVTMYGEQLFRVQQLAETVVQQPTKENLASLTVAIQSLPDQAPEKEDLVEQLEQAKEILAQQRVEEAKTNPNKETIQAAKEAVGVIQDETKKQQWMNELQQVETSLQDRESNEEAMSVEALLAKKAIERAERYPANALLTYAYQKVAAVPLADPHLPMLQEALARVQAQYDAREANNGNSSQALTRANALVKALEKAYSSALLSQAQKAVNALSDGENKDLLQARIDQAVRAQEAARVQAQMENAAKAVAQAEALRTKSMVERAEELVKALPDGQVKQALQARLSALRSAQDPAVAKAVEAIQLAKRYPTVGVFYKRAVDAIQQVQDVEKRKELTDLLNTK